MQLLQFLIGEESFPVYRTVEDREVRILRALLGADFCFELADGEPMDDLLFQVLSPIAVTADFFFVPPPDSTIVGTFELRDAEIPAPQRGWESSRGVHPGPRVH